MPLFKAKAAAEKKRKKGKSNNGNPSKKFKSSSDFQLFRGKTTINFYFVKVSTFFTFVQVPAAATVATVQDTVPRTVESRCLPPQTRVESFVQAVPQLLDPEQEVLPTEAQSNRGDNVLFFLNSRR